MWLLKNLRVSVMIMLVAAVPILSGLGFAGMLIRKDADYANELESLNELVQLGPVLAALVHEQQKERGATAVFLTSKGEKFGDEMKAQRLNTDARRADVENSLVNFSRDGRSEATLSRIDEILADIERLAEIRGRVDTLSIGAGNAVFYYSKSNEKMLKLIEHSASLSIEPTVTASVTSYANFLEGKDEAGLERAVGSSGFATGKFSEPVLNRFESLIATQDLYFRVFLENASEEIREDYKALMAAPAAEEVKRMRKIARTGGPTGDLQGIEASQFFDAMTTKMSGLKTIEDRLAELVTGNMETVLAAAWAEERQVIMFVSVTVTVSLLICILAAWTLSSAFKGIVTAAGRMAEGDLETDLPPVTRNEFGRITDALCTFRTSIIERRKLEEKMRLEQDAEREREQETAKNERRIAKEIAEVVEACSRGDFTRRLDLENKDGTYLDLCRGINAIGDTTQTGLDEVRAVLDGLASGDLTLRMNGEYQGIFDEIRLYLNSTTDKLKEIVGKLTSTAISANETSRQVAESTDNISHRTSQQAASLEETAAAMEELSVTTRQNNENAQSARTHSDESSNVATKGGEVVSDAVNSIGMIQESSRKIADIVGTIDGLAFQTNLLALNASVEAARAGDQGKGFAVVAAEVRNLASRSAEASQEIKTLIENSISQVETGVTEVSKSGDALREIIESVAQVTGLVKSISVATTEQSTGLDEIHSALVDLDHATQANAAMVEKNVASARTMSQLGNELVQLVSFFSTGEEINAAPVIEEKPAATPEPAMEEVAEAAAPVAAPAPSTDEWDDDWDSGWEDIPETRDDATPKSGDDNAAAA